MQPYFFPYIGYFQLAAAVDVFVVYDNVKYTKKGWINRNRVLQNGKDAYISLPLKSGSDQLDVNQRYLSADFKKEKFISAVAECYRKAPYFSPTMALFEKVVYFESNNLFDFLLNCIRSTFDHLSIPCNVIVSSSLDADHSLKGQDRVLSICKSVGADVYINPIGGADLYAREVFLDNGISLRFLKPLCFEYKQFGDPFIPWLSIIDFMMFNSIGTVREQLLNYELV